ncbi:MAG: hypothetical protein LLG14_09055 [Nocardiaceae bacterium]|nr:hypothetical protein [Nocardiaceae bacterium]
MKLGKHPQRTPFYGVLLNLGAYYSIYWAYSEPRPLWVHILHWVIVIPIAIVGTIMTFRDYSF